MQQNRRSLLESLTPPPGAVLFLGDSITEGGEWAELLPGVTTVNRGVSGETSGQVLSRIEKSLAAPAAVCLLVGTNDLTSGVSQTAIVRNIETMLRIIARHEPGTPVVLTAVFPRTSKYAAEVFELNQRLNRLASGRPEVQFVNLWDRLADATGAICPEYSFDGLHLSGSGYSIWADELSRRLPVA
nr:GDSL-like Lipase/Acylhydrolase family [uncultured organism]